MKLLSWFFLFSGKEAINNTITSFVERNLPQNEVVPTDVNDFEEFLKKMFGQVSDELHKAGYYSHFAVIFNSKDDIRISYIIPDNELVTEQKQEEVNKIFQDMIIKHNMNPNAFTIQVSHEENALYK